MGAHSYGCAECRVRVEAVVSRFTFSSRGSLHGRINLEDEAIKVRVLYGRTRPPQKRYRLDRLVACEAKSGPRWAIELGIWCYLSYIVLRDTS